MFIDAHCHLEDDQFKDDLDAVVARAVTAGVVTMVTAGSDIATSQATVALAERFPAVYATVGIHPHHAAAFSQTTLHAIRALSQRRKVVAIGEIGLDLHYPDSAPREIQEKSFVAQLDLAQELDKPVVIHDRDAHAPVMAILEARRGKLRGMLHCFSGSLEMARRAVDLGYYISFAGNVTFSNARELHVVAAALPLERILIETDSPYLSPRRGRRNEPANVIAVAAKIAELQKVDPSVVQEAAAHNSRMLFRLTTVE